MTNLRDLDGVKTLNQWPCSIKLDRLTTRDVSKSPLAHHLYWAKLPVVANEVVRYREGRDGRHFYFGRISN